MNPKFFSILPLRVMLLVTMLLVILLPACDSKDKVADKSSEPDAKTAAPALIANPENGAQVAQACVSCHPTNGDIVKTNYPQINGQLESYLAKTLQDFLSGTREHEGMNKNITPLSKQEILDVASYYASLATQWKQVLLPAQKKKSAPSKKMIAEGEKLAESCFSCHGPNGNSEKSGIPSLAGLSAEYIAKALDGYFTGERKNNEFMKIFKHAFDSDKIAKLGAFFSTRKRTKSSLPAQGKVKAGEKLATQSCIGCHGEGGNSNLAQFPSLAGQNYQFLKEATLSYSNGQRNNALMQKAIKGLSKTNISNLAAYFASQTPASPVTMTAVDSNDPLQMAEQAAGACFGCHGKNGNSQIAGTPNLSSQTPDYLATAINQYQTGTRQHELMKSFVVDLSKEQVNLVSIYFANQEPAATQNAGKGNPDNAKDLTGGCESCHGAKGISTSKKPSIAGQDADYLVQALIDYQTGKRDNSDMQKAVTELSKSDFTNLASYFAVQTPAKPEINLPQPPEQLAEKCNRCHLVQESRTEATGPRIAGQSEAYLLKAINDFKTKVRDQSTMFAMLDVLGDWEISRLANYYARLSYNDQK